MLARYIGGGLRRAVRRGPFRQALKHAADPGVGEAGGLKGTGFNSGIGTA
jgi:hypothetical protein